MTAMTYLWRIIVILCLFAVRSNAICRQCKLCLQTGAGMGTDSGEYSYISVKLQLKYTYTDSLGKLLHPLNWHKNDLNEEFKL